MYSSHNCKRQRSVKADVRIVRGNENMIKEDGKIIEVLNEFLN